MKIMQETKLNDFFQPFRMFRRGTSTGEGATVLRLNRGGWFPYLSNQIDMNREKQWNRSDALNELIRRFGGSQTDPRIRQKLAEVEQAATAVFGGDLKKATFAVIAANE